MKTVENEISFKEEYYPISPEVLASFPKYRPSVDFYVFREDIGQLYAIATKGLRLTEQKIVEITQLCQDGCLFVPRSDHHIYVEHLSKQADFVLIDPNLNVLEIVQIIKKALHMRLQDLAERPLPMVFATLRIDLAVLAEYLSRDTDNINAFMQELYIEEDEIVSHSINTLIVGLWLYFQTEKKIERKTLDTVMEGLLLHDLGCTKLPSFILQKKTPLTRDEMARYVLHPSIGLQLVQKLGCNSEEVAQIVMQHHERIDGSGYPNRFPAAKISPLGALAAVADSFSSMIMIKPYAPRQKTLSAAQLLFKDSRFLSKYTGLLAKAYTSEKFRNI